MSIFIKGMKAPETCWDCFIDNDLAQNIAYFEAICPFAERFVTFADFDAMSGRHPECPLVEVPPHGRLIDADKLHKAMYHRAFETDGDTMWQSGCWVRYRAIEQVQNSQPTIIEAEEGETHD